MSGKKYQSLILKQRGPRVLAKSVRIYKGAYTLRLSADLLSDLPNPKGELRFDFKVNLSKKELRLHPSSTGRLTWKTSPRALGVSMSIGRILPVLGISRRGAEGEYPAEVKRGTIIVYLAKKL